MLATHTIKITATDTAAPSVGFSDSVEAVHLAAKAPARSRAAIGVQMSSHQFTIRTDEHASGKKQSTKQTSLTLARRLGNANNTSKPRTESTQILPTS